MSYQLAAVTSLGLTVYMVHKVAEEFIEEDQEDMTRLMYTLSMLPVIGLNWTGYGIAQNQSLTNAEQAFIVSTLFSCLVLVGMIALFTKKIIADVKSSNGRPDTL